MSCVSVLRLGPTHDNVSAGMLRNAVLDFFAKKLGPEAVPSNDTFRVTNKYFDAQILLKTILDTNESNDDSDENLPHKEDGIILVFDAAKSNPDLPMDAAASFGSLGLAHDKAVQVGGGDLLRLCVGVTIGSMGAAELRGQSYEKEFARRVNWCLDRGYEYVECDLSPEAIGQGHEARDKEGFARVVEAIGGTMWSSAVMNKSKKTVLKKSYEEETAQMERENKYVPPDPSMLLGNDAAREDQARQAILEQSGIAHEGEAILDGGGENVNPDRSQQEREREQERMFDNLESALRQASSIREMSRTADLSDDDRRKRAGDAASLLMTLMQQVGMDDETDNEQEGQPVQSS
uniref:Uncharacterized protein n=1 Tax=Amphora coffeiformis TaxID=265554 RepID=A0A7S3L416_9STRA|eukprot:scaffold2353_cov167-Amphora_coffeaeformis.AAC.16